MESFKNYCENHKKQIKLAVCIMFLLTLTCVSFIHIENKYTKKDKEIVATLVEKKTEENDAIEQEESEVPEEKTKNIIMVDVKGFVINEGVYSLNENARVIDAINAAGGLKESAYTRYLNLSKIVHDEDVIILNSLEEIEHMKQETTVKEEIQCELTNKVCLTEEKIITSTVTENNKTNDSQKNNSNDIREEMDEPLNTLVNINTATKETLMSLKGIGESKADKIIEYRNTQGTFKTIDEIKNVSGIGDSVYEKIKDYITVQ